MRQLQTPGNGSKVEPVIRACALLQAFRDGDDILRVQDLTVRTRLHKATVSRLLHALEAGGLVERIGRRGYRSQIRILQQRTLKIGYASQTEQSLFAQEVTSGLRAAAGRQKIELVCFDNCYEPEKTVENVDRMIANGVDVAIEFQTFEAVAQVISSKFQQARIPLISVDMPYPGAVYFGGNNYQAGLLAGRAVGRWARRNWNGEVDEVVLLGLPAAGPLPELRLTGGRAGLVEILPSAERARVIRLDSGNTSEVSYEAVHRHLSTSQARRIVVLSINDPGALGALAAFRDASRMEHCAIAGQGATLDARLELRRRKSRLVGTVAFFPERYGANLVRLALDLVQKKAVPPAVYTKHRLITADNADSCYPEDVGLKPEDWQCPAG